MGNSNCACLDCEVLKFYFGFPLHYCFQQIVVLINLCSLVINSPKTETRSFLVSEIKQSLLFWHSIPLQGVKGHLQSGLAAEQMNIQIITFLIMLGLQKFVFDILKDKYGNGTYCLRDYSCLLHIYRPMWKVHYLKMKHKNLILASR